MNCNFCGSEFLSNHFNQKMCSDDCRHEAKKLAKSKHKASDKGVACEKRWRKNPRKKEIDKAYYTSEKGRASAVTRQARLLKNVYYLERKRIGQRAEYRRLRQEMFSIHSACQACGSTERLTIDHIKPMSLGGKHEPDNIQVLCLSCNASKGQRTINYGL